jgi:Tfp pilus assembly protein PilF
MYERARQWPSPEIANRIAQELLPKLLVDQRTGEALDIARERIRAAVNFRVMNSTDLLTLAQLAKHAGDRAATRAFVAMFARDFPQDPQRIVADRLRAELRQR